MITNRIKKTVASLAEVKGRRKEGLFLAEGTKCVLDTLGHFSLYLLIALPDWISDHSRDIDGIAAEKILSATRAEIKEMSTLSTIPAVMAVYRIPEAVEFTPGFCSRSLVVALDRVQDPGNLGTIIRTCDWMGVTHIVASRETVDVYNPKTVQATMGAISRVAVTYTDLPEFLASLPQEAPVYGTFLDGENIYTSSLGATGVVVMGNEGSGISDEVAAHVTRRLLIPSFPPDRPTSESLNVATATAIALSQFRCRQIKSRN